jgi:hypothetical protein
MFQVIIPALKAAAPAVKFAAGVFGATLVMAFSGVAYYGVARTGIEAVDQRIANKRAARATREAALKDIRNYVNSEIQRQVDAGTLVRPDILHGNTEADKALRHAFINVEIQRRIDAGLLVPASCPTPTPA